MLWARQYWIPDITLNLPFHFSVSVNYHSDHGKVQADRFISSSHAFQSHLRSEEFAVGRRFLFVTDCGKPQARRHHAAQADAHRQVASPVLNLTRFLNALDSAGLPVFVANPGSL